MSPEPLATRSHKGVPCARIGMANMVGGCEECAADAQEDLKGFLCDPENTHAREVQIESEVNKRATRGRGALCPWINPPSPLWPEPRSHGGRKLLRKRWAQLIRRVYEVDPLVCVCGATMRIVAIITERSVITKILAHLGKVAAATAMEGSGPGPPRHPSPGPAPDPSIN